MCQDSVYDTIADSGIGHLIIKIRWLWDHLVFTRGIYLEESYWNPGAISTYRCHLTSIELIFMKIRQSQDALIFMMRIPVPGKTVLRQCPGGFLVSGWFLLSWPSYLVSAPRVCPIYLFALGPQWIPLTLITNICPQARETPVGLAPRQATTTRGHNRHWQECHLRLQALIIDFISSVCFMVIYLSQ